VQGAEGLGAGLPELVGLKPLAGHLLLYRLSHISGNTSFKNIAG